MARGGRFSLMKDILAGLD